MRRLIYGLIGAAFGLPLILLALLMVWEEVFGEQPQAQLRNAAMPPEVVAGSVDQLPKQPPYLRYWLAAEQVATGEPLVGGNRVQLLPDGPQGLTAKFDAVAAASEHVHIDIYQIADDDAGRRLVELLRERLAAGVEVRIIFDAIGSDGELLRPLADDGAQLHEYLPPDPLAEPRIWKHNRRNHRKLLLADGREALLGGMNVVEEYREPALHGNDADDYEDDGWRDIHLRIDGPAVTRLQELFLEHWERLAGPIDEPQRYLPPQDKTGDQWVRPLVTAEDEQAIYGAYLNAVRQARERIWLTHAYFVPNPEMRQALVAAAERGVDVRILLPGFSNYRSAFYAGRAQYEYLLEHGVRLYERHDAMVHAKTAVVDGAWATVGSANFDYRSFMHNHELNAVIVDAEFAAELETVFLADLEQAVEIELPTWRDRPLWERSLERGAALFSYWL